jgi:Na+-transporting methylmalonyl-CoA/oxaloacetate decarboxylase gamma subunit
MAEQRRIFGDRKEPSLYQEGATLMAKGAGYGAIVFFGVMFFIFILVAIGALLPPESKEAPDPSLGAIEAPAEIRAV